MLSTNATLAQLTPSQWANTYTEIPFETLRAMNPDGSNNGNLLFKGQDGTVCEYEVISTMGRSGGATDGANDYTSGPVQCHGTSINGF
jgi:hypothetical protein